MSVDLVRIHHVAYRCMDAKETVDFYQRVLNMGFVLAIAEDEVPSTKEPDPYMHVFLDAGMGNVLAFFELPKSIRAAIFSLPSLELCSDSSSSAALCSISWLIILKRLVLLLST